MITPDRSSAAGFALHAVFAATRVWIGSGVAAMVSMSIHTVPGRDSELTVTKKGEGPLWRHCLRAMGPGLVTGASDDDPSGIATYSQVGAKYGFSFLWVAWVTLPLMAAVQEICDRTALATGKGLGELAVLRFGRIG
jgi:Natural resistance-associated macrophage protein